MKVSYPEQELPVLWSGDVVVVGATLCGITAALEFSNQGKRVALVEPRTYPGTDLFAVLRPWLRKIPGFLIEDLPLLAQKIIKVSGKFHVSGEYPLHPDLVKLHLEDHLLEAQVKILYASQVVQVMEVRDGCLGLVIGNKSGRQVLTCRLLLDATENALPTRLAGGKLLPEEQTAVFSSTIEFDKVGILKEDCLPLPVEMGIIGSQVKFHRGYRGRGHQLVEFHVPQPGRVSSASEYSRREYSIRQKAIEIASYLRKNIPAFQEARLAAIAQEAYGPRATQLAEEASGWAKDLDSEPLQVELTGKCFIAEVSAFAGPIPNLWCLNGAARLSEANREFFFDPLGGISVAQAWARRLVADRKYWASSFTPQQHAKKFSSNVQITEGVQIWEPAYPQRGRNYAYITVPHLELPTIDDLDVLVVGGGSSGAVAAITAASMGMQTALVDMNPGLGGTGTFGGVDSYWCGFRGGVVPQVIDWVNEINEELGYGRMKGLVPLWKPEVKNHAFLRRAVQKNVALILSSKVIGAIRDGKVVCGIIAATPVGPIALLGKVVIDATGDGDVAAYAGAEYLYGSERDHATMWYALHMVASPGVTRNNFTSTVDIRNIEDYTRAILSGRRRGKKGRDHDHTTYIAPRESRHILGDEVLELNDHLLRRSWPDVIYIAFSNNDIKGQISSDWMRMGLIPPHLEIEIPYGALLPRGLENILVTGKALSTTHDSLAAIRMQADMENLGAATAVAAALAVKHGCTPRKVDIRELQELLVSMDLLPAGILDRKLKPIEFSEDELRNLIATIDADKPLYEFSDMRLDEVYQERIAIVDIVTAGEKAIPLLENELERSSGKRKVLIAQMLALMGSQTAVPVLVEELMRQFSGDVLPVREHDVAQVDTYAPDQAAMPFAANLLYSLGMTRDKRALPVWQRVVDLLKDAKEADIWSQEKCVFHYVDAICVGAEQLGSPNAVPILKQLHGYPIFHGQVLVSGFQADYLKERQAYLEVVIGRALARCGSPEGVVVLINFLQDVRGLLAEQAHDELVAITGQDFGKDIAAWTEWLETHAEKLKPIPWTAPTEAQAAWNRPMLTTMMDNPRKAFGRDVKGYKAVR